MTIGNDLVGGTEIGSTYGAGAGSAAVAAPLVFDPPAEIFSPAILQFFDIEASNGDHLRVVDWGDPDQSVMGEVTFDGNQWQSVQVGSPAYETDANGRLSQAVVAVADPTRSILAWVLAHDNLRTAKLTARIIKYQDLATPANVIGERVLRFKSVNSIEGPARVQFSIGTPSIFDLGFPFVTINRFGCHHVYERRHQHTQRTFCTAPSDEFGIQTAQFLSTAFSDDPQPLGFGLWTANGVNGWAVGGLTGLFLTGANVLAEYYGMKLENDKDQRFDDTNTEAQYCYKRILELASSDTGIDVQTRMLFTDDANTQLDQFAGIIIVSESDPTDWLMAGFKHTANGGSGLAYDLVRRQTTNGVSADTTMTVGVEAHNSVRVSRSGNDWTIHTRDEDVSEEIDDSNAWTARGTFTWTISGSLRVGLINCWWPATQSGATQFDAYFTHLRFTKGGFKFCDRSQAHCAARENTHQRSGYLGLPDSAVRF